MQPFLLCQFDEATSLNNCTYLSSQDQRKALLAHKLRAQLLDLAPEHRVLNVLVKTGSGNTIEMAQCLAN